MKKLILLALAPLAMLGTHASAQTTTERTVVHQNGAHTTVVQTDYRNHRRGGYRTRRVCSMQWRHHHRVRVCRTVRSRRHWS